jgi:hypothetical protein
MQGSNERRKFVFLDVLKLVDKDDQCSAGFLGSEAHRLKERLQIVFEISVVGEACFRVEVKANFDIGILDFERFCETA